MYKIIACAILILISICCCGVVYDTNDTSNEEIYYVIYDDRGVYLFEKTGVSIGDYYITNEYAKYEIVELYEDRHIGIANFIGVVDRPDVKISDKANPIYTPMKKVICMYMTHNDESYVPTDGVDSVYGAGGVHDVAKYFADCLNNNGIEVYVDETLHIPHDTRAYNRSSVTAKNLIDEYEPNAIFDIHRDGTSRSQYAKVIDGKEQSMIRMVVGKANKNMDINESFAVYLMAVGNEISPGLFKDIYYASGHYNQALHPKSILFEMGCHMIEKELVLDSCDKLANVVNVALFNTTVDDQTGDLTINDTPTIDSPTIDAVLDAKAESAQTNSDNTNSLIRLLIWAGITIASITMLVKYIKRGR